MAEAPEANKGWLLENLVYLHLRRQKYTLNYINTSDGKEVDFHAFHKVTREKKLVQVSWSIAAPETREREIAPLVKAGRELGIRERLLITWDEEGTAADGVQIIPV